MSTKGRYSSMKDKKERSPSLPKKTETRQPMRSPNPRVLELKTASTSTESRKLSDQPKPARTSTLGTLARNPKNQPFVGITKPLRQSLDRHLPSSKVTNTKPKPNKTNFIESNKKTVGLLKPKDVGKPRLSLKSTNVRNKKQTSQPTKGFDVKAMVVENKPCVTDARSLSEDDQKILIYEEDEKTIPIQYVDVLDLDDKDDDLLHDEVGFEYVMKIPLCEFSDLDMIEFEICYEEDKATIDESVIVNINKHTDCQDEKINEEDQTDESAMIDSDHFSHPDVDRENQVPENEVENQQHEEPELEKTKPDEPELEETNPNEPEDEETEKDDSEDEESMQEEANDEEIKAEESETEDEVVEVPKTEDSTSKVVAERHQVVVHGKKDTAAYNDVIEKTVIKLREQRKNRVKALVGAFETVISLESEVPQVSPICINNK